MFSLNGAEFDREAFDESEEQVIATPPTPTSNPVVNFGQDLVWLAARAPIDLARFAANGAIELGQHAQETQIGPWYPFIDEGQLQKPGETDYEYFDRTGRHPISGAYAVGADDLEQRASGGRDRFGQTMPEAYHDHPLITAVSDAGPLTFLIPGPRSFGAAGKARAGFERPVMHVGTELFPLKPSGKPARFAYPVGWPERPGPSVTVTPRPGTGPQRMPGHADFDPYVHGDLPGPEGRGPVSVGGRGVPGDRVFTPWRDGPRGGGAPASAGGRASTSPPMSGSGTMGQGTRGSGSARRAPGPERPAGGEPSAPTAVLEREAPTRGTIELIDRMAPKAEPIELLPTHWREFDPLDAPPLEVPDTIGTRVPGLHKFRPTTPAGAPTAPGRRTGSDPGGGAPLAPSIGDPLPLRTPRGLPPAPWQLPESVPGIRPLDRAEPDGFAYREVRPGRWLLCHGGVCDPDAFAVDEFGCRPERATPGSTRAASSRRSSASGSRRSNRSRRSCASCRNAMRHGSTSCSTSTSYGPC